MESVRPRSFEKRPRSNGIVDDGFPKHWMLFPVGDCYTTTSNCRQSARPVPQILRQSLRGINISQLCRTAIRLSLDVMSGTNFFSSGVSRVYLCDTE